MKKNNISLFIACLFLVFSVVTNVFFAFYKLEQRQEKKELFSNI